jgi:hypothetical protein
MSRSRGEARVTFFEFILVMISVIYALSVAPLLSGVARLSQTRLPVRHYLPQSIWAANIFVLILLSWWALWSFREIDWMFSSFIFIAIEPVLLYFMCSLLYPQRLDGPQVDMKAHFQKIRRFFFATNIVLLIMVSIDGIVLGIEPLWNANRYFQGVALALIAWSYFATKARSQLIASIAFSIAMAGFVAIRWLSPPG